MMLFDKCGEVQCRWKDLGLIAMLRTRILYKVEDFFFAVCLLDGGKFGSGEDMGGVRGTCSAFLTTPHRAMRKST